MVYQPGAGIGLIARAGYKKSWSSTGIRADIDSELIINDNLRLIWRIMTGSADSTVRCIGVIKISSIQ